MSLCDGRDAGGLGDRLWLRSCGSSQESGPTVQGRWALLNRRRLWNAEVVPRIFLGGSFLLLVPRR